MSLGRSIAAAAHAAVGPRPERACTSVGARVATDRCGISYHVRWCMVRCKTMQAQASKCAEISCVSHNFKASARHIPKKIFDSKIIRLRTPRGAATPRSTVKSSNRTATKKQ